jgi:hypothetical protein
MSDAFSAGGRLQAAEWVSEQERKQRRTILVIAILSFVGRRDWCVARGEGMAP